MSRGFSRRLAGLFCCLLLLVLAGALAGSLAGCQAVPQPAPLPTVAPTATVEAGTALLHVQADPPGSQVSVDGQARGASPLDLTLPAGPHEMVLSAGGFITLTETITLTAGQEGTYAPELASQAGPKVTLSADPPQVSWLGQTRLHASAQDPAGVTELQLLLDGQLLGDVQGADLVLDFSPAQVAGLAPGTTYTLTARALNPAGGAGQATLALAVGALPEATPAAVARVTPRSPGGATPAATRAAATATPAATRASTDVPQPTETPDMTGQPTPAPEPPDAVSYTVTTISLPTYPYAKFVHAAVDPALGNYPLQTFDRAGYEASNPQPAAKNYTLLVMENRYLRLSVLPELGGRIYECVFKPTNHNEFYRNPVVKPSRWGPAAPAHPADANWWLGVGGMEWGFPVEEHGYEWASSWGYDHSALADGSQMVTVFTGDYQKPFVSVQITLAPDQASFTVEPRIVNPTSTAFRFKFWADAMLAPGGKNRVSADTRIIVPGNSVTVHSSSDPTLPAAGQALTWPTYNGRDLSRLGNWGGWLGFFARPAAQANFAAVYDTAADEGMVRVFPANVAKGLKIFGLGWGQPIDPHEYTDDNSSYIEMHGGPSATFDDWAQLAAGDQIGWSETWYPAAGIHGVTAAQAGGAVNVTAAGQGTQVNVFAASKLAGRIEITLPGKPAVTRSVQISPDKPFSETFAGAAGPGDATVTLYDPQNQVVATYRGPVK